MTFIDDIRGEILAKLPYDRGNPRIVGKLQETPTTELMIWFYNWMGRLIHQHPRNVHLSNALTFRRLLSQQQVDLDMLCDKIRLGGDLTPHLSKRIVHGYRPVPKRKSLGSRLDLDLLLNEWGIHHLHFSQIIEADGFSRRIDDILLFAVFRAEDAYLLDIGDHSHFEDQHFVEVAVRNWPAAKLFVPLNAVAVAGDTTPEDRKKLRRGGISSVIQVDGQILFPATGGISAAGTSAWHVPMYMLRRLNDAERRLHDDPHCLDALISQFGKTPSTTPRFRVVLCEYPLRKDFGLLEEESGAVIGLV